MQASTCGGWDWFLNVTRADIDSGSRAHRALPPSARRIQLPVHHSHQSLRDLLCAPSAVLHLCLETDDVTHPSFINLPRKPCVHAAGIDK